MKISTSIVDPISQKRRESREQLFNRRYRTKKVTEWMIDATNTHESNKSLVIENIFFTSSLPVSDFDPQQALKSKYIENTINVLKDYDPKRLQAGLNPNTIMTEYRRKVILQSLAYGSTSVGETSQQKLQEYECLKDTIQQQLQQPSSFISSSSHSSSLNTKQVDGMKPSNTESCVEYHPSWNDYDHMKRRWKEIVRPSLRIDHPLNY